VNIYPFSLQSISGRKLFDDEGANASVQVKIEEGIFDLYTAIIAEEKSKRPVKRYKSPHLCLFT